MTDDDARSREWAAPGSQADAPAPPPPAFAPAPPPMPGYAPVPPAPASYTPPPPASYAPPAPASYAPAPPPIPGYQAQAAPGVHAQAPTAPLTFRSWQPGIVALRPLPFGDFITIPFKAMRFNRATIVGAPLLMLSLATILTAVATWLAFSDSKLNLTSTYQSPTGIEALTLIMIVVTVLAWIVADMFASAIVIPAVGEALLGTKLSFSAALKKLVSRFWALLGFGALVGVYFTVVAALVAILFVPIIGSTSSEGDAVAATIGAFVIGFIVVMLAGLPVAVYAPVARGVIVMERRGPWEAIKRSFTLVKGRFWWTVLIVFVLGAIAYVVQQILGFGTQLIVGIGSALAPQSPVAFGVLMVVGVLFQAVVSGVTQYSMVGSALALVYFDLRIRKEGLAFELARAAEARHHAAGPSFW